MSQTLNVSLIQGLITACNLSDDWTVSKVNRDNKKQKTPDLSVGALPRVFHSIKGTVCTYSTGFFKC